MSDKPERIWRESHRTDAARIQDVAWILGAHRVTLWEAEAAWMNYSEEEWAAGWIGLPSSDRELWTVIESYFTLSF